MQDSKVQHWGVRKAENITFVIALFRIQNKTRIPERSNSGMLTLLQGEEHL